MLRGPCVEVTPWGSRDQQHESTQDKAISTDERSGQGYGRGSSGLVSLLTAGAKREKRREMRRWRCRPPLGLVEREGGF